MQLFSHTFQHNSAACPSPQSLSALDCSLFPISSLKSMRIPPVFGALPARHPLLGDAMDVACIKEHLTRLDANHLVVRAVRLHRASSAIRQGTSTAINLLHL